MDRFSIQTDLSEYRNKQDEKIIQLKTELDQLKNIVKEQGKFSESHRDELDNLRKQTIKVQQQIIDSQKSELDEKNQKLKEHQQKIDSQKSVLDTMKNSQIEEQQQLIDWQRKYLVEMRNLHIKEQDQLLNSQMTKIEKIKDEIGHLKLNPVPIGFIYVQLSNQSEPKTLWPNTQWTDISAIYAGLFFRAEGGQSSSFGQTQEQQTQSLDFYSGCCTYSYAYEKWQRMGLGDTDPYLYTGTGGKGDYYGIKLRHNREEIRPRNQAVRIWQRIK